MNNIDWKIAILIFILGVIFSVLIKRFGNNIEKIIKKSFVMWNIAVWLRTHKRYLLFASIGITLVMVISVIIVVAVAKQRLPEDGFDPWIFFLRTPGTFFALFMAVFTVSGFTITITRLYEMGMKITRYDELLIRTTKLLKNEITKARQGDKRTIQMLIKR